ncbi:MAG: hypothetical protein IPP15_16205 [Saprospiraceae bacterium]|uniref:Uncharacterized protein n=1 Tax=Candidatus Opimibacter skivensis TaxID=2982028 RepID=A0A9D7SXB1_9BACT|nr:hypothetical protein [Candidatus Opimibacter skivensis]
MLQPVASNEFAPEKKLVFVRRIASVYEISSRVIEHYDNAYRQFLNPVFSKNENKSIEENARAFFYRLSKGDEEIIDDVIEVKRKIARIPSTKWVILKVSF